MWMFSNRKSSSGFSVSSTAEEVTRGIDASALTAIVTGASSGIGAETVRVLALRGVHVIMGVRNLEAGKEVREAIIKEFPNSRIEAMELDLSSMASVRKFAADFKSSHCSLNLLINNAGIMATPFMLSKDNIELQFAANHVGHFLLTNLLLETIKKTARESRKEGRIVNVSSRRHQFSYREGIRFSHINSPSGYNRLLAYGQSKLANVLHTLQFMNFEGTIYILCLTEDGAEVTANSVHPGFVATNLFRHYGLLNGFFGLLGKHLIKDVHQGAATTCYVALHPQVKGVSGRYFADNNIADASSQATDENLARKLWDFSLHLVDRHSSSSQ